MTNINTQNKRNKKNSGIFFTLFLIRDLFFWAKVQHGNHIKRKIKKF